MTAFHHSQPFVVARRLKAACPLRARKAACQVPPHLQTDQAAQMPNR